jgi:uracil-DNA glycosylase
MPEQLGARTRLGKRGESDPFRAGPAAARRGAMIEAVPESWRPALADVLSGNEAHALVGFLDQAENGGGAIYPPRGQRLRALELTPLDEVRVVILGQDPYHGMGQAHGLAFSVPDGVAPPPSLANIHKELAADLGIARIGGNLEGWARQGVLLLNNSLTVAAGQAGSHRNQGWEAITDAMVSAVANRPEPSVFILWGADAQAKAARIAGLGPGTRHHVMASPHPSPLSAYRGFFGSKPFSRANAFLKSAGRGTINWSA